MLNNSRALFQEFGQELFSEKMTFERLWLLLDPVNSRFSGTIPYIASEPMTDNNHSQLDAMKDFVRILIEFATSHFENNTDRLSAWLHRLVNDLLRLWLPQEPANRLFRNNSLAKTLLAYELAYFAGAADQHFSHAEGVLFERMQELSEQDKNYLRHVILSPQIVFFKNPEADLRDRSFSSPVEPVKFSSEGQPPNIPLPNRRPSLASFLFPSAPQTHVEQLAALVSHYTNPVRQSHEKYFNPYKLELANGGQRLSRAEAKAAIAQALLDALQSRGEEYLPQVFKANLTCWQLQENDFFDGKTLKILSPDLISLIKREAQNPKIQLG